MVSVIRDKYNNFNKEIALLNIRDLNLLVVLHGTKVMFDYSDYGKSCFLESKNIVNIESDSDDSVYIHELGHAIHYKLKNGCLPNSLEDLIDKFNKIDIDRIDKFLLNIGKLCFY